MPRPGHTGGGGRARPMVTVAGRTPQSLSSSFSLFLLPFWPKRDVGRPSFFFSFFPLLLPSSSSCAPLLLSEESQNLFHFPFSVPNLDFFLLFSFLSFKAHTESRTKKKYTKLRVSLVVGLFSRHFDNKRLFTPLNGPRARK